MSLHEDLTETGLSTAFKISGETENENLRAWLGKTVRYKRSLTLAEAEKLGSIVVHGKWVIKATQLDYRGKEILRGFLVGDEGEAPDTFGRPIRPEEIEQEKN